MGKKSKAPRTPSIKIDRKAAERVMQGHPWIFADSIVQCKGHMPLATLVKVLDEDEQALGFALYSQQSKIRARVLTLQGELPEEGAKELSVEDFTSLLLASYNRRHLLGFSQQKLPPFHRTDAHESYRLVNSEGDGIPGLTIDVLGELIVVQITTMPLHRMRDTIFTALCGLFPEHGILDIPAPDKIMELEGFEHERCWRSEHRPERVEVNESGVLFELVTEEFQKTGHYADMRPHREWIAARSKGASVLDAYSYTGGFGLHAASKGAARVMCVDSSAQATSRVLANAKLNHFEQVQIETSRVDRYLDACIERGQRFDITVLDPPKLAPNRSSAHKALKVYESLCVQGLKVTERGGLFCITSCSEAIGEKALLKVLSKSAAEVGCSPFVVYTGAQAADHPWPAGMSEGRYATFVAAVLG